MFEGAPSAHWKILSVYCQYSVSDSPFTAKTGVPASAIAEAAWSCVEKMLHEAQRTSAPNALSVSISTAVWMVMWSEPEMRAPFRGFAAPNSSRQAIRPGISVSAMSISLRPQSASEMSLTMWSGVPAIFSSPVHAKRERRQELPPCVADAYQITGMPTMGYKEILSW